MDNKCFVFSYDSVINDDTLPKLNTIVIRISQLNSGNAGHFYINFKKAISVKSYGGYIATSSAGLANHETEITQTVVNHGTLNLYYENKDYYIEIDNKYAIEEITVPVSNSVPISFAVNEFEHSELLTSLEIHDTNVEGDINFSKFSALGTINIRNTAVKTNIENLPISITKFLPSQQTTGDLIKLAKRLVEEGGTSGVTFEQLNQGSITFGTYSPTSNGTLNWESASKINYSTNYTNVVYAYGYSAEEIATWEQGGKTVYVVQ